MAGAPAAIENGGTSRVTTLFAPITARSPIVTPPVTTTFAPHQTLSPTRVGPFDTNPCQGTGRTGSSKRWLPSVMKQPLANMQWSPISTSSTEATITPMLRKLCEPIRMRAPCGAVSHACGSRTVCSPISSRPSLKASSTFPCSGQRANARLRIISRWIASRFQGSELRSYQRHFCPQSQALLTRGSLPGAAAGVEARRPAADEYGVDPLSDLLSADEFDRLLAREELRRSRTGETLAVALLDVDGLRQVGDRHGRDAAAEVLRLCASVLRDTTRTVDAVAHTGDDEFSVLLHATDVRSGIGWADRFEDELERAGAQHPAAPLTCALGLADTIEEASLMLAATRARRRMEVIQTVRKLRRARERGS